MGSSMNLNGSELRQFQAALLSAFPDESDLRQMTLFGLSENLRTITHGDNLQDMVFELITWARTQSRLDQLLQAALDSNPHNEDLQAFAAQIRERDAGPPPP